MSKMGKKLKVGDRLPDFKLKNQDGEFVQISWKDEVKKIIYFYPKDNTKVCTEQACSFRDWQDDLVELGYQVIGISSDSPSSHLKFKAMYNLNFELLSDEKKVVRTLLGATSLLGFFPSRKTFLTNSEGIIEFIYDAFFEGNGHIEEIKEFIKESNLK